MMPVIRALLTLAVFGIALKGSAQLEDVSLDYVISASTGEGFLGCGLSCADFNGDGRVDVCRPCGNQAAS